MALAYLVHHKKMFQLIKLYHGFNSPRGVDVNHNKYFIVFNFILILRVVFCFQADSFTASYSSNDVISVLWQSNKGS